MAQTPTQAFRAAPLQQTTVGGSGIAWRSFGSGPALLLVHGVQLSGASWRKLLPALAARFTCYVPDLPGMGESRWSDATDFTWHGQAATLKGFMDALGVRRYSVLAHDTAGTFARCLALTDPRVERLALINTEIPGHRPPWIPLYQKLMALPGATLGFRLLLRLRAFNRSPLGFGGCFVDRDLIDGDFHEQFIAPLIRDPQRMEGTRRYLRALTWDVVDGLATAHARLQLPVQLIWGADDPTFPHALARDMVRQLPQGSLVEIPGTKLLPHEERPEAVAAAALAFLAPAQERVA
jgi:haloalkane dehalogenase